MSHHPGIRAIEQVLDLHREGHGAGFMTGRSLYDFDQDDHKIRPVFELLRRELYAEHKLALITYSLANGLNWFESGIASKADRMTIQSALEGSGLLAVKKNEREVISTLRAITQLLRSKYELKWADGNPMHFAVCIEFAEHALPCAQNGGFSDEQLMVIELIHIFSHSLVLRESGNIFLLHGKIESVDPLAAAGLKEIHLAQPSKSEKLEFVTSAMELYDQAKFEEGLTIEGIAALTADTPNRGIENRIRASHRTGSVITVKEIVEQKNRDVQQMSEGTLMTLDTRRVSGVHLVGRNIETAQRIFQKLGRSLLEGNPATPSSILVPGAPATGKTDLVHTAIINAQCAAYQMVSPKAGVVGETERRSRLQQRVLGDLNPGIVFCDEVTEILPLERGGFDGDSGASKNVSAELLIGLSDESRRGRSLFIGATNRVWAIGAAMLSRFVVLPVISALREDYPAIIVSTARRITTECQIDSNDSTILEAANVFYSKGANPRHIRSALINALLISETRVLDGESVLLAAHDLCSTTDRASSEYADLQAIRYCTSKSFLPWNGDEGYDFPDYLRGIVDETSGDINESELGRRIRELEPHVNV